MKERGKSGDVALTPTRQMFLCLILQSPLRNKPREVNNGENKMNLLETFKN